MRCRISQSDGRRATRMDPVVVLLSRKRGCGEFTSHAVTGNRRAVSIDVIRKTTGADHHSPCSARDNDGIWHNIQLRAVRQRDPKKTDGTTRGKKGGRREEGGDNHQNIENVNQDLQMRLVGMKERHIRCIKSSSTSAGIHVMCTHLIPGSSRHVGWGRSRGGLRATHIRVPRLRRKKVDCGELLTRSLELLLLHLGLSNLGGTVFSLALQLSLRLVRQVIRKPSVDRDVRTGRTSAAAARAGRTCNR